MSAAFFIGARCKPFNDDFMLCKTEANGTGEIDCMREGRKVTRCAASVYVQEGPTYSIMVLTHSHRLEDINKSCLTEFRRHWECLENNNQQLWQCRKVEKPFNKCVFDSLVSFNIYIPTNIDSCSLSII